MGTVCDYGKCETVDASTVRDSTWSLDLEDIEKETGRLLVRVRAGERAATGARHAFRAGDLLYSKLRTYLNKVLVADEDGVCSSEILPLDFKGQVLPEYARCVLMSPMFLDYAARCGYGVKMPRLGTTDGCNGPFPLPPLVEQRRIVSRFKALSSLCDSIDEDSAAFDNLARTAKSRILDLAIHGDLVPQNPTEEPASALLDRIRSTADKPPCPNRMSESFESPFPIPDTWEWTTIREINEYERKTLQPDPGSEEVFELYSVPVFENGLPEFVKGTEISSPKQVVRKGDVLVCKINPRINRVWNVAGHTDSRLLASSEWIVVRAKDIVSGYLKIVFQSPYFRAKLLTNVSGVGGSLMRAQAGFVMDYPFPIPPLAEQRRIVAKVEELFSAIDAMATK